MNLRARIICCRVLALGALTSAAGVVCSIAVPHTGWLPPQPAPGSVYVLRDCGGSVAVYDAASSGSPLRVTTIETKTLPQADRELLGQGLSVSSEEELLTLLEDLGS